MRPDSLQEGQSDFGKAVCFAYANSISVGRAVSVGLGLVDDDTPEWFAFSARTRAGIKNRRLDNIPRGLREEEYLKFCPVCAQLLLFPQAFEFAFMSVCPAHQIALRSRCEHCGERCLFRNKWSRTPLLCPTCRRHWFGAEPVEDSCGVKSALDAIAPEWEKIVRVCRPFRNDDGRKSKEDWSLILSARSCESSIYWEPESILAGRAREFVFEMCERPYRAPELAKLLHETFRKLKGDVCSNVTAETRQEAERLRKLGFHRLLHPAQVTRDRAAHAIAIWEDSWDFYAEKKLLFRQSALMCGVPMFRDCYGYMHERCWRGALLALLYGFREAWSDSSRLYSNSFDIQLANWGRSYFAHRGRYPELDCVDG